LPLPPKVSDNSSPGGDLNRIALTLSFCLALVTAQAQTQAQESNVRKSEEVLTKAVPCTPKASYPVHLTFDDGPKIPQTEIILDILKKEGIKATFFLSFSRFSNLLSGGKTPPRVAALLKRMQDEGHQIGSHSYDHIFHADDNQTSQAQAVANLQNEKTIRQTLGLKPPLPFRFPFGSGWFLDRSPKNQARAEFLMAQIKSEGLVPFHWDIDTWDWSKIKRKALPDSMLAQICSHQGGAILLHDVHSFTAENLPALISSIRKSGHNFVSYEELNALSQKKKEGFVSFADSAVYANYCREPRGDYDSVWRSCTEYRKHSSDRQRTVK